MFSIYFILFNGIVLLNSRNVNGDGRSPGEISKNKCKDYSKYAPESSKCGVDQIPTDNFALEGNVPHMGILGYKSNGEDHWACAGSLISEDYLLVPAHCLESAHLPSELEVARIGATNVKTPQHFQDIKIKKKVVHPDYKPPSRYNDIGLVQLEKKVDINEYVRPACLHTRSGIEEKQAIGSGWGITDVERREEFHRQRKVPMILHDNAKCNETFKALVGKKSLQKGVSSETMLCVEAGTGSFSVVTGALQIPSKDYPCMYEVIATASFGRGYLRLPEVYTRISPYISWIEDEVWK